MDKQVVLNSPSGSLAKASWRDYVHITKPRIVMENLMAAFAGFWVASQWSIDWFLLTLMLIGSTLVMASASTFNNILDRDLDMKMARTQKRPFPSGKLKPVPVIIYASTLGISGLVCLLVIHPLAAICGAIGIFVYVIVYTMWLKRHSTWSTSIGGISGSMPPVIGYVAVSETLDMGAWILFAILFLWQPPHFWTLGIRRKEEYRAAGFPLLPVVKGVRRTKWQMIPYVVLLIPVSTLLYFYNYTGMIYLITALILGFIWLWMCIAGLWAKDDDRWAKKNFMFSIQYLTIILLVMIIDTVK